MSFSPPDIRGIIWDLDGTLYRYNDLFIKACNIAAARAAQSLGVNISYEESVALAVRSENEHGYSLHGFIHELGLSYDRLHHPFHEFIDENLIEKNEVFVKALERLNLPQVLLTNASRGWANRTLTHLGMKHLFPDNHIIAMEDVNYTPKARGPAGFEKAMEVLALPPGQVAVVDDLPRNLVIPKSMGIRTVFITHGCSVNEDVSADWTMANPLEICEWLKIGTDRTI